ncbi:MAG: hypothetical protein WBW67_26940, partial [Pseudolabrys sp.]
MSDPYTQAYDSATHTIDWSNNCPKVWENSTMSRAKQSSKRKSRACAVPLLGAAGLSLSMVSGAPAATVGPTAHEITLGEEEISDVSLATFYVFDKENGLAS